MSLTLQLICVPYNEVKCSVFQDFDDDIDDDVILTRARKLAVQPAQPTTQLKNINKEENLLKDENH